MNRCLCQNIAAWIRSNFGIKTSECTDSHHQKARCNHNCSLCSPPGPCVGLVSSVLRVPLPVPRWTSNSPSCLGIVLDTLFRKWSVLLYNSINGSILVFLRFIFGCTHFSFSAECVPGFANDWTVLVACKEPPQLVNTKNTQTDALYFWRPRIVPFHWEHRIFQILKKEKEQQQCSEERRCAKRMSTPTGIFQSPCEFLASSFELRRQKCLLWAAPTRVIFYMLREIFLAYLFKKRELFLVFTCMYFCLQFAQALNEATGHETWSRQMRSSHMKKIPSQLVPP